MVEEVVIDLKQFRNYNDQYILSRKYDNYHLGVFLANLFNKKRTMLNVGIHYVSSLIICSNTFKTVHGFEPDIVYNDLLEEIQTNNLTNVHLHNLALSSYVEKRKFWSPKPDTKNRKNYIGGSSLNFNWSDRHPTEGVEFYSRKIKTSTLDFIVQKNNINNIDYIKVDTEWEDTNVIKGAFSTIEKYKPIIQVEDRRDNFNQVIKALNYKKVKWSKKFPVNNHYGPVDSYYIHKALA